jgi:hypothetical protein
MPNYLPDLNWFPAPESGTSSVSPVGGKIRLVFMSFAVTDIIGSCSSHAARQFNYLFLTHDADSTVTLIIFQNVIKVIIDSYLQC